ncbi:MAG: molybdopterin-dependent oxidoreductase [Armatimonadetes bacterium]|nr:molybdopterin-dependent oxidoreductase [Armatimonadota bacterium]
MDMTLKTATAQDITYSGDLEFLLNGRSVRIAHPDPAVTLSEYLHGTGLTGTRVGCGQGGCGACTVMLSHRHPVDGTPVHRAINACLKPLCALDGMAVTTVEGLGNVRDGLDPAQFCIAAGNGTQCGFCTPGFAVNAHVLLRNQPSATQQQVEDSFGGNICRCTGYRPILQALRSLASDYDPVDDPNTPCEIDDCFPLKVRPCAAQVCLPDHEIVPRALHFSNGGRDWWRPPTLAEARRLKKGLAPDSRWVAGNTAVGIYPDETARHWIDISALPELFELRETSVGVEVGASVPIQHLLDFCASLVERRPAGETAGLRELVRHGKSIAGVQVRSAGSVAGNVAITLNHVRRGAPFPSDLFLCLSILDTRVTVASDSYEAGARTFPLLEMPAPDELPADGLMVSFLIPYGSPGELVQTHRVARRPQNSHAFATAGFRLRLDDQSRVEAFTAVFGGLARGFFRARKTEELLAGRSWSNETLRAALPVLEAEIEARTVPMEEEGLGTGYRRELGRNFFYKFFLHAAQQLAPRSVDPGNGSAAEHHVRPLSRGEQEFTVVPELFPLTRPIIKQAAFVQASGEARFTQDLPLPVGGLHARVVCSRRPHADFTFAPGLEARLQERFPDFRGLVTAADIPEGGNNLVGLGEDDPVFCDGVATSAGAPLGLVLAETARTAREAAAWVEREGVSYRDRPAVLTLEQAIEQDTSMPMLRRASDPDDDVQQRIPSVTRPGSNLAWLRDPVAPMQVSGSLMTGPQAHFYLETMCALAVPGAYDHITVHNSTQNPNGDQRNIARALGVQANQVSVVLEQVGGGFGGKQHRAGLVGCAAAIAARKARRPVRLLYERATDTSMVGKRHPYLGSYTLAFNPDGRMQALRVDLASDAGDSYDCSFAVMDLSLLMADGCYQVETFQANGTVYRTHKPSNTAFRTFGTVQPYLVLEDAVEQLSHRLGLLPEKVRRQNFYRTGTLTDHDETAYGQALQFCAITELWDDLWRSSDFQAREAAVGEFNRTHRWRKRGICMLAEKYGIGFTEPRGSLNSSSALVNVNMSDGSVVVAHGGVEMGQGLHTKIAQVAACTLGIPLHLIRVGDTNSDVIVNAPATAASTGFDLNAGAVEKACQTLRNRLERFCRDLEQFLPHDCIEAWRTDWAGCWPEIVYRAWSHRISLSAAELYGSPHYQGTSERHPRGHPFLYFVWAAAATEVEIDVLTGEFEIVRADVLYDAGRSPNPAIDVGQIEGGYVQGVGFVTTEEVLYDEHGALVTDNTWTYKPPCSKTIPVDFRVRLRNPDTPRDLEAARAESVAVKSSKTAGEPGLVLGISAYFAIKRAILAARLEQAGESAWFRLDVPATAERIQTHCLVSEDRLRL